jgi:hypothetical protein
MDMATGADGLRKELDSSEELDSPESAAVAEQQRLRRATGVRQTDR